MIPNLAIIRELRDREPDAQFLYLGTRRGPERRLVEARDISFLAVPARPSAHPRKPLRFLRFAFTVLAGTLRAIAVILRFRPHVVVATGGYASVPPVLAAALLRRPIFLHEQNVKPGKANLFLSRFATRVGVSFEETLSQFPRGKAAVSGYPVRRRIAAGDPNLARERLRIPADQRVAFVLGGSMGSRSINRAMVDGLGRLLENPKVTVIHSTGLTEGSGYDAWKDTVDRLKGADISEQLRDRYILRRYFDQIEDAYAASDLVVARAGAGVVMELATLGKPALLIPKSDGADNHQLVNALSLRERGIADVILEEMYEEQTGTITRVHGDQLARKIDELLADADRLGEMSQSAKTLVVPDAGANNAEIVSELARSQPRRQTRSVQHLVGKITDEGGAETELLFPVTTIGHASSSDLRLTHRGRGERAIVRRFGSTRLDTDYILVPRRGRILVDGNPVVKSCRLSPGQTIELGPNRLSFHAGIQVRELTVEKGSILGKIFATGFGTLLSRLFGLVREIVLAAAFGAGRVMDVMVVSLTASNLFRRIFAENAVDSAFLPSFLTLKGAGRHEEAIRLFRTVLTVSILLTASVVAVGMATVSIWMPWVVPGFAEKGLLDDAVGLTRIMLPYLMLITVAAVLGAFLKAHNRFAIPAWSSIMFSLGLIVGVGLYPRLGLTAIGVGVLLGGLGQVLVHLAPLLSRSFRRRTKLRFRPLLGLGDPGMRKVRSAAPKIVADVTTTKIGSVVDVMIVSTLSVGHPSVLYFSLLLFQLPFALVSQSINTVALKEFSSSLAVRDQESCRRLVTSGINWNIFLLLPISALMVVLAEPIVDLLLHYGAFRVDDSHMVATALGCYSVGLVGWGLHGLMGRFYAARLEIGQAMLINLAAVILNIILSLSFVAIGLSFAGIALGTSIAFLANGTFRVWHLNRNMKRDGGGFSYAEVVPSLWRSAVATLASTLVGYLCYRTIANFDAWPSVLSRLFTLGVPALAAMTSFVVIASVLRSPEMDDLWSRILRQLPRSPRPRSAKAPLNVYCLRPEQLLRTAIQHPELVRDANLTRRVKEFLGKASWKQKNIGVKLVGLLAIRSLSYELVEIVTDRRPAPLIHRLFGGDFVNPGFVRRNALRSLAQIESLGADVERAILVGLGDPYFEVRSAACRAVAVYARQLTPDVRRQSLVTLAKLVRESNFEVAMNAVVGLQSAALDESVLETLRELHYHPNWKVRHEVVRAYYQLYKRGLVEDRALILERLDDVLITCDSFHPSFELKETMRSVRSGLTPGSQNAFEDDS